MKVITTVIQPTSLEICLNDIVQLIVINIQIKYKIISFIGFKKKLPPKISFLDKVKIQSLSKGKVDAWTNWKIAYMIQLTIKYQIEYEIIPIRSTWYSGMTKHQKNKLSKPTASGSTGFYESDNSHFAIAINFCGWIWPSNFYLCLSTHVISARIY